MGLAYSPGEEPALLVGALPEGIADRMLQLVHSLTYTLLELCGVTEVCSVKGAVSLSSLERVFSGLLGVHLVQARVV